ncbi:MAG: hypothetical protein FJW32_20750 [Acidobacteria bacterium]|nr:hypothetical protein [Acidobacteriota bacterium]
MANNNGGRRPSDVIDDLNARIDRLVQAFEAELAAMTAAAIAKTAGVMLKSLTVEGDTILRTRANARALRDIAKTIKVELGRAGVRELIEEFGATLAGQMPLFDEILSLIGAASGRRLSVDWTEADREFFASRQLTVESGLETIIESAALAAQRRVMFTAGGLPFGDLVEAINVGMRVPVAEAVTLAETSQAAFWRTITDQGFQKIEKGLPAGSVRYRYEGPKDKLTRPFCQRLLARTKREGLTRAEIDALDNGQLPDAFHTAGGYRCRHQWVAEIVDTRRRRAA